MPTKSKKKGTVLSLFILISIIDLKVNADLSRIIHTNKGPVQGEILQTVLNQTEYLSFRGIPYAKPPIDELKFKVN